MMSDTEFRENLIINYSRSTVCIVITAKLRRSQWAARYRSGTSHGQSHLQPAMEWTDCSAVVGAPRKRAGKLTELSAGPGAAAERSRCPAVQPLTGAPVSSVSPVRLVTLTADDSKNSWETRQSRKITEANYLPCKWERLTWEHPCGFPRNWGTLSRQGRMLRAGGGSHHTLKSCYANSRYRATCSNFKLKICFCRLGSYVFLKKEKSGIRTKLLEAPIQSSQTWSNGRAKAKPESANDGKVPISIYSSVS